MSRMSQLYLAPPMQPFDPLRVPAVSPELSVDAKVAMVGRAVARL